ncbi:MAG TPA: hypothetical protein VL093_14005 [Flavipsychrobacter sp.]|nr:hypothetical protein [Flavipsychrobacter sp.]
MYKKLPLSLAFLLIFSIATFAQELKGSALVKGRLVIESSEEPASDIQIAIPYLKLLTTSDGRGNFAFSQVPFGTHRVVISSEGISPDTISIVVDNPLVNLGDMIVSRPATQDLKTFELPVISLDQSFETSDNERVSTQSVSSLLTASRDPFLNTAAYTFGANRFQTRGYERNQQEVFINGMPVNDIETGDPAWNQWGGLNDVFRNRNSAYGLQPADYAFGGVNGSVYLDATAASQRKQTRATYSLTNRTYRNRLMLTHSSGISKKGWAYALSFSRRWAKEGYVPGTFYDGYSYYAALSKRIGMKHTISLTTFGAPTQRGKMAGTYQEAYNLAGSNFYNPNWGYLNGKKRNAKVANLYQPITMLNYEYTPDNTFRWNTIASYQFGKNENSSLDWYNATDPRPDYYKKLPGYYLLGATANPAAAEANREAFIANPQINWEDLYHTNSLNIIAIPNADGTPSSSSGKRSLYVIGDDVDDIKKWTVSTSLQKAISSHLTLYTGANYISQKTESYRDMNDLLGGDFFLNVNSFTERNFAGTTTLNQNDINHPNQLIKKGDKYLYDYIIRFTKAWWWGQAIFSYNKVDFFLSANYGFNSFQREGLYRNGLYATANESLGKGEKQNFSLYGLKGGITYKFNGRNYLFVNAGMASNAPNVDATYFSARSRNAVVEDPTTEKYQSVEGGYLHRSPRANVRVVGYATDMKDQADVQRFFYTGTGTSNAMVDYVLQHMDTRNIGTELAFEYKFTPAFSAAAIAAIGQSFYTNNPKVTRHYENTVDAAENEDVYIKDYYLGVGPQSAYSLAMNYRSKQYWMANLNFNYFDRNYIDIAATRRTVQATELVPVGSEQWNEILNQEKFDPAFTVDFSFYKSWLLSKYVKAFPRNTYLGLNIGISNLLDNKNLRTGGYENLRYDYAAGNADKFASKYFYAFGRNYFINLSLRF